MMSSASPHTRMIIFTVLAGLAVLAALWVLAISPKRSESAKVRTNVAAQELRLSAAQAQLAGYEADRKAYPRHLQALRRLDGAVPARGEVSTLLRELQKRANASSSDLRLAALKPAATPVAGLTPGASSGSTGLATLPFSFSYTGKYFDLVKVLAAARRSVTVRSGRLKIDGRLVTIEGLTFERVKETELIKANVSGTAYIAAAPAPPTAVPAAATAQGGS